MKKPLILLLALILCLGAVCGALCEAATEEGAIEGIELTPFSPMFIKGFFGSASMEHIFDKVEGRSALTVELGLELVTQNLDPYFSDNFAGFLANPSYVGRTDTEIILEAYCENHILIASFTPVVGDTAYAMVETELTGDAVKDAIIADMEASCSEYYENDPQEIQMFLDYMDIHVTPAS